MVSRVSSKSASNSKVRAVGASATRAESLRPRHNAKLFRALAVLLWAASTVPTTILMSQSGRVFGEATPYTPATQALRYGLIVGVLALSILALLKRPQNLKNRPLGIIALVAFAVYYPAASSVAHGDVSFDEFFTATVSLALILALFTFRVDLSHLSIVGALGAATGAVSLGMAALRPESAYAIEEGGRALAGPFNNSNYLGTVLILSLPFALLLRKRMHRLTCLTLTVLPILMGGSKTSIATLAALLAVGILLLLISNGQTRALFLSLTLAVTLSGTILLPFAVSHVDQLTGRGAIWLYARQNPFEYIPFGAGRQWFADHAQDFGFPANHAHHILLDPLIVGGIPYLLIVLALLAALYRFGQRSVRSGQPSIPALFAIALTVSGGLGNFFILDIRDLRFAATGFVIVLLLALATNPDTGLEADDLERESDFSNRDRANPGQTVTTRGRGSESAPALVRAGLVQFGTSGFPSSYSRPHSSRVFLRDRTTTRDRKLNLTVIGLISLSSLVGASFVWLHLSFYGTPPPSSVTAPPSSFPTESPDGEATDGPERLPTDGAARVDDGSFPGESASFRPALGEIANDTPSTYDDGCHVDQESSEPVSCTLNDASPEAPTVALIGDSHAAQWSDGLRLLAKEQGWNALSFTKSACGVNTSAVPQPGKSSPYSSCTDWNNRLPEAVREAGVDLILTSNSTYFSTFSDDGESLTGAEGFQDSVRGQREARLQLSSVAPVVEILDLPVSGDQSDCLSQSRPSECFVSEDDASLRRNEVQKEALSGLPDVESMDFTRYICQEGRCPAVVNGVVTFRDSNHITAEYSKSLATPLGAALREKTEDSLWSSGE